VTAAADLDRDWLLGFLRARRIPGLESVEGTTYRRAIAGPRGPALWQLELDPNRAPRSRADPGVPPSRRRALARRLLDSDTDLAPFRRLIRTDRVLGPLVRRRPGLRLPLILEPFEAVTRALVGQQVSVAAAGTMIGRIVARFGASVGTGGGLRAFPDAGRVAEAGAASLTAVGLTGARATAIAALARALALGELDFAALGRMPSEEAQRTLDDLPGVGPWTAAYLRMRFIGDRDAFPESDLGVIRALERLGVAPREIGRRAERWRPWRAYATLHLWASLAD
jgi:3-methyladenine DNA glycosylase/8-oxoguanine DNA glycosylase